MARPHHVAFVCPRFAEGATLGGAETLLRQLAERTARAGCKVSFLATCARDHFTWKNELPAGTRTVGPLEVTFFPVDEDRDIEAFLAVQDRISRGTACSIEDEQLWLRNSVNSRALCDHLRESGTSYDRIVIGPYLFGLVYFASQIHPERTVLVPCLHDEAFAYTRSFKQMFHAVRGIMFNSRPERDLAIRLYEVDPKRCSVVGMGLDPFESNPRAFATAHPDLGRYILYSGRREPLKGTPLLLDYFATYLERTGRELSLVLTGSGSMDVPASARTRVHDLGFVSEEEKHRVMAGATAFCHPSVNESFSIVLMESWLARVPALVHGRCEVLRYHCRHANGGLWFTSYVEFEEELTLILEDEAIRKAMGESGHRYVRRQYSWEMIEQRMFEALD